MVNIPKRKEQNTEIQEVTKKKDITHRKNVSEMEGNI